ncbi:hypothetical protein D6792_02930 [Candidatus Parcubacteria bacterium]|nr:MAG: hypothetical protein D6792_02930 [Candidatus Parcubacteria bacterium]
MQNKVAQDEPPRKMPLPQLGGSLAVAGFSLASGEEINEGVVMLCDIACAILNKWRGLCVKYRRHVLRPVTAHLAFP